MDRLQVIIDKTKEIPLKNKKIENKTEIKNVKKYPMLKIGDIVYVTRTNVQNNSLERKTKLFKGKIISVQKNYYVVNFFDVGYNECYRKGEIKKYEIV